MDKLAALIERNIAGRVCGWQGCTNAADVAASAENALLDGHGANGKPQWRVRWTCAACGAAMRESRRIERRAGVVQP